MTTYLRQHGLMSFIKLNIPEREINLHFVNSAWLDFSINHGGHNNNTDDKFFI
jgi:hypothetical protein